MRLTVRRCCAPWNECGGGAALASCGLLLVVIVATALGSLGGLVGQQALVSVLGDWFGEALPAPGLRPALVGLLFGLSMALGFAVPTLLRVGGVPPLRVLRREMDAPGLPPGQSGCWPPAGSSA